MWSSSASIFDPDSWKPGLGSVRYRCRYEDGVPAGSTKEYSPLALANQEEGASVSYKEFWWASALSRMDTRDALADVHSRLVPTGQQSIGSLVTDVPPEEVTTFNLVRRLVNRRTSAGGRAIALHSRPLEGGNRKTGRKPSGCDLELAVEVGPGLWVDLALQAKKFLPHSGIYRGWSHNQNSNLIQWATRNGNRTPGMLLYNTEGSPFASPGSTTSVLGACCTQPKRCHGWKWPGAKGREWSLPDDRTPMAVSLVLNQSSMLGMTNPTPKQLAEVAFPLECIFCPNAPLVTTRAPSWALTLLESQIYESATEVLERDDDGTYEDSSAYSVVLGLGDQEATDA